MSDEIEMLRSRLEKIDNHRHQALQENARLSLIIEEYRKQMSGQFVIASVLRDWFAGQALIGMMGAMRPYSDQYERSAKDAYKQADAMMAERMKGQTPRVFSTKCEICGSPHNNDALTDICTFCEAEREIDASK